MGKALVIVESPAKAKTISKYLSNRFVVKSSVGHIRDLPKGRAAIKHDSQTAKKQKKKKDEKQALVDRMGIDPWHGWTANYQVLPGKEKVVAELKTLAEKAEHIFLATDRDREGEAIAWHLRETIGGEASRFSRVVFNEITRNAITRAFDDPGEINIDRVNAQQARRFLDRVVGFMVSPLLWKKIARGLSAGRVQSVAVRLIVEREQEIKEFVPEEFWQIEAKLHTPAGELLSMQVVQHADGAFRPVNKQQTDEAVAQLKQATFTIASKENKPTSSKPNAPFITSTLQQAASTRLGFSVKKTMMIAQKLYEFGYITYMRTDSTNLSQEAVESVRGYIHQTFGARYLPDAAKHYASKENAQEAHEAIRPSNVDILSEQLEGMDSDAQKLYQLVWRQFVACQMTSANYDSTTLTAEAGEFKLRAKGRTLRFDGWTRVMPPQRKKEEDMLLPEVEIGAVLTLNQLIPAQHFMKPAARFSEATLVRELEKRAIGRPSTYASIISTIQERGYVRLGNRRFYAEKMGEIVNHRLEENFRDLMNYDFTAHMEDSLDQIANNQTAWKQVLDHFFNDFTHQLALAEKPAEEGGMRPNQVVLTSIKCPNCQREMGIRTASTGVFLGCSGYALPPKERCKQTINLIPEHEALNVLEEEDAETNALRAKRRCQQCGTAMDSYLIDEKTKLHVCGNNPACSGYAIEQGEFRIKGYDGPVINCEKCAAEMHLKMGRFGKYMACTNSACGNTRKILRSGEIAPPKEDPIPLPELKCAKSDAYFVLRDGAAGLFLAANTFPKSRETRAPLVEELQRFAQRLPEKFHYLTLAPAQDPEGNKTQVRYSRKTKQQYILSEKAGKPTGWSMYWREGEWQPATK